MAWHLWIKYITITTIKTFNDYNRDILTEEDFFTIFLPGYAGIKTSTQVHGMNTDD